MKNKWYAKVTNKGSAHDQGLVIEENTGETIAVTFKPENAALVASAPELLEFVKDIQRYLLAGSIVTKSDRKFVLRKADDLINQIENA